MERKSFDSAVGRETDDHYDVVNCTIEMPESVDEAVEMFDARVVLQGFNAWFKQNAFQGSKADWLAAALKFGPGSEECEAAKEAYALTPPAYKPGSRKASDGITQKAATAGVRNLKSVTSELPDDATFTKAQIAEMLNLTI